MSLTIMGCTTEVEYISIYDKPKKAGRPKGSTYTDEQNKAILEKLLQTIITIIRNIAPFNNNYLTIIFVKQTNNIIMIIRMIIKWCIYLFVHVILYIVFCIFYFTLKKHFNNIYNTTT